MKLFILLSIVFYSLNIFACIGFLPENNLSIPPSIKAKGLSEEQFNSVIEKAERIYAPVAQENNAVLKIHRKWEESRVNAGTYQDEGGKHWHVNLYGGLARHEFMTEDAYLLVICHELGHHIGGSPKKTFNGVTFWSSSEGQADYWATLKCFRRVLKGSNHRSVIADLEIPPLVERKCEESFYYSGSINLCKRTAMAGLALGKVSSVIRGTNYPQFHTPDPSIVNETYQRHPLPQCRLDTYFQGSLCDQPWYENVSQNDDRIGTCHSDLDYYLGLRPLCWYKP